MYNVFLILLLSVFIISLINYNIKRRKFEEGLLNIVKENTQQWHIFSSFFFNFLGNTNSGISINEETQSHEELISLLIKNILLKNKPPFTIEVSYGSSKQSTIRAYLVEAENEYLIENLAYKNYSKDYSSTNLNLRMIA